MSTLPRPNYSYEVPEEEPILVAPLFLMRECIQALVDADDSLYDSDNAPSDADDTLR